MTRRNADHNAPFRDIPYQSDADKIARVVAIGPERLVDWWERFRDYTHPGTYGDSGCEFASSVAYLLAGGAVAACVYEENQSEPRYQAARRMGAKINLVGAS